jgi:hypothetical protein
VYPIGKGAGGGSGCLRLAVANCGAAGAELDILVIGMRILFGVTKQDQNVLRWSPAGQSVRPEPIAHRCAKGLSIRKGP